MRHSRLVVSEMKGKQTLESSFLILSLSSALLDGGGAAATADADSGDSCDAGGVTGIGFGSAGATCPRASTPRMLRCACQ